VTVGRITATGVTYTKGVGSLALTITGCSSPDVKVTGPNSFQRLGIVNGDVLTGLTPGVYTVSAGGTGFGPAENTLLCKPLPATQQVTVPLNTTASASVTYHRGYGIYPSGGSNGTIVISAPGCTPAVLCGVTGYYPEGTSLTITATANAGYRVQTFTDNELVSAPKACTWYIAAASDTQTTHVCNFTVTAQHVFRIVFGPLP
jgi:hypothetical protein